MQKLVRLSAILLSLSIIFALAGCRGNNGDSAGKNGKYKNDEERIQGDWVTELKFSDVMEAYAQEENEDIPEELEDVKGKLEITMTFDDGEATLKIDADGIKDSLEDVISDALIEEIESNVLDGMTVDEAEEYYGMTLDEILEQTNNTTFDELLESYMDTFSEMFEELEETVDYEFEDGKLYFDGDKKDYEFDGDDTLILEVEELGGELEFERD